MQSFIFKEKLFSRSWFLAYSYIIIGAFIMAVGYVYFITPNRIVPGGIYGITIVLHHTFHFPVGLTALAFNIPLTLLGIRVLGPRFGIKTIVGFVLGAVFIDLLTYYSKGDPLVESDPLLSSIFGGLLIGLGVGLIFKSKATAGGSDVIAMIIAKYTRMPLGQLMIIVDSVIVLVGLIAFRDWKIPLYSWIVIFIMGKVIDVVLEGISYHKSLFIISDKHKEIGEKIIHNLRRGGTFITARGIYEGTDKTIIFSVVNRRELAILKEHIKQIDPNAFVTVIETKEILGKGFKSLDNKD